ncbi:type VII secretion protein EccE [Streptomyces sp. SAJ15]|uniref:type VII secretion protein EccE n=1 Tax=Streptomyces sp. SAJ15 TaxID=2011095 RepID=UPI001185FEB0|nr:type VII secretion protein EccE [Streptomyces sp. SAJ15]TVL94567.1 type VII secretion protein EccE [Streptomyces sp. SAJ15]
MSSATRARTPERAVPRQPSRTTSLGAPRLRQLVLFEVAAALVLVAWAISPSPLLVGPAAAVAVLLLVVAVLRRRQQPVPDWLATAVALRRRQKRAKEPVPAGTDPSLAPAVECDPALRSYAYTARDRREMGMVGDGTFLTAVLQVQGSDDPLRPGAAERPLPLGLLRDALRVDDIRLESVQVVQHTQPAPAPHLPEQSVAARSYGPLQEQSGAPAVRLTWVALKLHPELCSEAVAARGGGLEGAQRCLVRAVDQLASRLAGAGFTAKALEEGELASAVATSACANPAATAQAARANTPNRRTVETSRAWRCDDRWHTTYWVGRWPQLGAGSVPLPQVVAQLTSVPALASTFSLTLAHGSGRGWGGEPRVSGHVRITGRSDSELVDARKTLERVARGVKVGLVRLDREQLPGMLATLPLGGTR